jgi:hypothetical protein
VDDVERHPPRRLTPPGWSLFRLAVVLLCAPVALVVYAFTAPVAERSLHLHAAWWWSVAYVVTVYGFYRFLRPLLGGVSATAVVLLGFFAAGSLVGLVSGSCPVVVGAGRCDRSGTLATGFAAMLSVALVVAAVALSQVAFSIGRFVVVRSGRLSRRLRLTKRAEPGPDPADTTAGGVSKVRPTSRTNGPVNRAGGGARRRR